MRAEFVYGYKHMCLEGSLTHISINISSKLPLMAYVLPSYGFLIGLIV